MAATSNASGFFARRRWLAWALGILAAVVLLASFMSRGEVVPVTAATVAPTTIRSLISTNGRVEPVHNFEAHAPLGTTVKRIRVREGEHVKKGELLMELDDANARSQAAQALAQVRAAQASLSAVEGGGTREELLALQAQLVKAGNERDAARRNLNALESLQQKGAASEGEVKQAQEQLQTADAELKMLEQKRNDRYSRPEVAQVEAQRNQAQAAYAAAENLLSQLNIRAPFAGVVYSVPVRMDAYVNPGDTLLREADLEQVRVQAFVDEPDLGRLALGEPMEVTWDAVPGRIWRGSVNTLPSVVKLRGTRNVGETTCLLDNHDLRLLPDTNVSVTIVTAEHHNVLAVPREAVRLDGAQSYVYQILNDQLRRRDIQTSISNLTQVEVTSGLPANSQVAVASVNSKPLHDGLSVRVVQ
ncbi:MAG TPA: efflux RND transporter periplasmic adaptor subunit [Terriglobales bacterium]|nr:efflux RND transporter periplasmic adaptor subunit [Terriglobales bacterium]